MGFATLVRNSTGISKRSIETKTAEKPKEVETIKQDSAQNKTQEASPIQNLEQNESMTEIPKSSQNTTDNPPKDEKVNENLPKTDMKMEIPDLSQNSTQGPPNAAGNESVTEVNQNQTEELDLTTPDGRNQSLIKAFKQEEIAQEDDDFNNDPKFPEGDGAIGYYESSTPSGAKGNKEMGEMMKPSDPIIFSSSSKVSDHIYLPLINFVILLWLVIFMYPKAKGFFNWIQKSLTKTDKNTRKRKKQKN